MYRKNDFKFRYYPTDQVWKFVPTLVPRPPRSVPIVTPDITAHLVDIQYITVDDLGSVCSGIKIGGPQIEARESLNKLLRRLPQFKNVTCNLPNPYTFHLRRCSNDTFVVDYWTHPSLGSEKHYV